MRSGSCRGADRRVLAARTFLVVTVRAMASSKRRRLGRRGFLKGATAGAAALVSSPAAAQSTQSGASASQALPAAERADVYTTDRPGADFMVDVIKSLGFEYVAANPGSSFRALHESLINYGANKAPELLTCCHEESSVAMAHGYAKIEGRPMMVMAHGTVGLQHASMAVYNAFADRVPVYIVIGNILDATFRRSDVEWTHAVQDASAMVRDYIKWDDTPVSLTHFAESSVRAYRIATTPPYGPVVHRRRRDAAGRSDSAGTASAPARAATDAVVATRGRCRRGGGAGQAAGRRGKPAPLRRTSGAHAEGLVAARRASRAAAGAGRRGPLRLPDELPEPPPAEDGAGHVAGATPILCSALEHPELFHYLHAMTPPNRFGMDVQRLLKPGTKVVTISSHELLTKSNYQDAGRYIEADLAIPADTEATLPALDRGVPPADHARAPARVRASAASASRELTAAQYEQNLDAGGIGMGREPDFHGASVGGDCGTRFAARTGRSCPTRPSSATGRCGCGTSRSTTSTSGGRARTESAMARRPQSARRWPIAGTGD